MTNIDEVLNDDIVGYAGWHHKFISNTCYGTYLMAFHVLYIQNDPNDSYANFITKITVKKWRL